MGLAARAFFYVSFEVDERRIAAHRVRTATRRCSAPPHRDARTGGPRRFCAFLEVVGGPEVVVGDVEVPGSTCW
ncbi:hypothetical protein ABZ867_11905 [Streptomyces cinnamoneus]